MNRLNIKALNEYSVVVHAGETVDEATFRAIRALNQALYSQPFAGFIEAVPAYLTLTVYYDPVKVLADQNLQGAYAFERVMHYLQNLFIAKEEDRGANVTAVTIPVCYGGAYGPDIEAVAGHNGLSMEEVIRLHTAPTYLVHMLGFMPGFPYLGGMDTALTTPRKAFPRKEVPQGSVGIGGGQTGIYPFPSPGGWQLIGRTPLALFNAGSDEPTLLKAGDAVRFEAITKEQFNQIVKSHVHYRN